ncbi:hypothetical protein BGZ83_002264 [Gryganskiella cystojenkinii]|nr:hypothetical protein BGZ83_002264 [Gryganskiella cystojenkinii]
MDTLYRNNSIGRHHKIQRELVENNRSSKDSCQSDKIRKGKVETIQNREDANSEQFIAFFGQATFKPKGYLPETITDIGRVAAILEEQRTRSTQEKNTHKLSNKLADGTNMSSQGSDGSRNLTDKDLGQDYDDKKITIASTPYSSVVMYNPQPTILQPPKCPAIPAPSSTYRPGVSYSYNKNGNNNNNGQTQTQIEDYLVGSNKAGATLCPPTTRPEQQKVVAHLTMYNASAFTGF